MKRKIHPVKGIAYLRAISSFKSSPLIAMENFRKEYGYLPYFGPPLNTLFLFHPEDIKDALIKGKDNNVKGDQATLMKVVLGESLFISEGETWRKKKATIQGVFHQQSILAYSDTISTHTHNFIQRWKDMGVVNFSEEIMDLMFNISASIFFGNFPQEKSNEVRKAFTATAKIIASKFASPVKLPYWVPSPQNLTLKKHLNIIDEFTYTIIKNARLTNDDHHSLLGRLINSPDNLSDREIRDEVVTFLAAGYETTATFIIWCLYLLMKNPESVESFKYAGKRSATRKHILNEALRLYPSFPINVRQNIGPMELAGETVAPKTNLLISPFIVHRDPEFWVGPNQFDPERYQKIPPEKLRAQFLPFMMGPKKCIGELLAYEEGENIIEMILSSLEIELLTPELLPLCDILLYSDKPLMCRVKRKNKKGPL
jgi:cytochrome P450